jgi:hypothetical protein
MWEGLWDMVLIHDRILVWSPQSCRKNCVPVHSPGDECVKGWLLCRPTLTFSFLCSVVQIVIFLKNNMYCFSIIKVRHAPAQYRKTKKSIEKKFQITPKSISQNQPLLVFCEPSFNAVFSLTCAQGPAVCTERLVVNHDTPNLCLPNSWDY